MINKPEIVQNSSGAKFYLVLHLRKKLGVREKRLLIVPEAFNNFGIDSFRKRLRTILFFLFKKFQHYLYDFSISKYDR